MAKRQPIGRTRLDAMIDSQFASVYLTLLSIIQSVALGFLATKVIAVVKDGGTQLGTGLLLGANFLFLILVWHLSMRGLLRRRWDPDILDGALLFSLGLLECILMVLVDSPGAWLRFLGVALLVAAAINIVAFFRLKESDLEDAADFERLRSDLLKKSVIPWLVVSLLLIFLAPAIEKACPGAFMVIAGALLLWGFITGVSSKLQRVQWP